MADPIEDAAPALDGPSTVGIRCPLLVFAAPSDAAAGTETAGTETAGTETAGTETAGTPAADPEGPSTAARCGAAEPAIAISLGQQRLVCFDQGHVDCPRFVRAMGSPRGATGRSGRPVAVAPIAVASVVAADTDAPATPIVPVAPVVRSSRRSGARRVGSRPRPVVVASVILVAALVVAFAFTSIRGGLALPPAVASGAAVVSPPASPALSPSPSSLPSPSEVPSPSPSQAASASVEPSPSPSVSPLPSSSPSAGPTVAPSPSASLPAAYGGLKPCPGADGCYLYRIHPGDNLTAIAKRFGISIAALKAANPTLKDPSLLHVGDKIRVPVPKS